MPKATTQFFVALILAAGLVVLCGISLYHGDQRTQDMLVGALVAYASAAGGWLFRLNGYANGKAEDGPASRDLSAAGPPLTGEKNP